MAQISPTRTRRDPRTFALIGAAMEVHRVLGPGFLEAVYQESLAGEMTHREIPFRAEAEVPVHYKEARLSTTHRADFICYECIIAELKAVKQLTIVEEAQLLSYLKATGFSLGMLFNFGAASLQYRRFVLSHSSSAKSA